MILEGIVTTLNANASANVSPMGPLVDVAMERLVLRPYQTSTTYVNLKRTGEGVFHVTDDVLLLAKAAVGDPDPRPALMPAKAVKGVILADACRWYAFRVQSIDDSQPRSQIIADVVDRGRFRDFFGFNRAKHAVVEAAILATRVGMLPRDEIAAEFNRLTVLVEKTGGEQERLAFEFLQDHVDRASRERFVMSPAAVRVTTPSRLHFGMLSFGQSGVRQFGGVGLMVAAPRIRLQIAASDRIEATGPLAGRAAEFARRAIENLRLPKSTGCRIDIESAPREHIGLGTGTQLGLAISGGLHALHSLDPPPPAELARIAGRCQRSSIGTHGFAAGGLLVEAGRCAAGEPSPLIARVELPDEWRFLLLMPKRANGLFGEAEREAFGRIPPIPPAVTDALAREALMHLLPGAIEGDFVEFSRSLYRYGKSAGECFASQQHGAFLDRRTAELVDLIRRLGIEGVGQSSWGPTLFAAVRTQAAGRDLAARLTATGDLSDYEMLMAPPSNHGARIEVEA